MKSNIKPKQNSTRNSYELIIERLLDLFRQSDEPLILSDIAKSLSLISDSDEYFELKAILKDLCSQGILIKSSRRRYSLNDTNRSGSFEGTIKIDSEKGTIETGNPKEPIAYLRRKDFITALDGDKVLVKYLPFKKGKKPRVQVVKVIERNLAVIYGTIDFDGEFHFLIPDESKYYIDFLVPDKKLNGAKNGDKVAAKLITWDDPYKSPLANVEQIIGRAGDPKAEFDSLVKELGLPESFPEQVVLESKSFPDKIPTKEIKRRLDLRKDTIITIDPEDAKDFDDALSLIILENGNYLLGVHIADVSYFVTENSAIDIEARKRGTSCYLADRVIPMIPERLSNELCSLKPGVDRLSFTVLMEISPSGAIKDYQVRESVINSKRRFNYGEVLEIINSGKGDHAAMILKLHDIATALKKARFRRGGIDFVTFETKFILDENGFPSSSILKTSDKATSLVEECMLAANKCIAQYARTLARENKKRGLPYLYRVHDEPNEQQIKEALQFIRTLMPIGKVKNVSSKELNSIIKHFSDRIEKYIVNNILIRSMAKAIYTPNNIGHYGLGFSDYTHFTSPIRRYPDLLVHRLIKEYEGKNLSDARLKFLKLLTAEVGKSSSERERSAIESERESTKLASVMLCKSRIGEEYDGTISGVTSFGIFVLLDEVNAEGLIHIRDLTDDYYFHDEKRYCLIGKHTKKIFIIGKRIRAKIIHANVEKRRLDLAYVDTHKS